MLGIFNISTYSLIAGNSNHCENTIKAITWGYLKIELIRFYCQVILKLWNIKTYIAVYVINFKFVSLHFGSRTSDQPAYEPIKNDCY